MPSGIYKRTEEHKKKIGLINKGKKFSEEHKRKISEAHKGLRPTKEAIKNMSKAQKGNQNCLGRKLSEETKRKIGRYQIGRKHTEKWRKEHSEQLKGMFKGSKNPNWKGGRGERERENNFEFKQWHRKVFERDNYTCQVCGDNKGGNLNAHHFESYTQYPELRCDINNGITLCKKCHEEVHRKNSKINLINNKLCFIGG